MKCEMITKTVGVGEYADLDQEEIVAAVARHGTIKEDGGKLVRYLMDNRHWSPLQHVSYGFKITTSRAISAQAFRHKSLEFQEFSQRYSAVPSVEPIELRMQHESNRQSSTEIFDPIIIGNYDTIQEDAKASTLIADHIKRTQELYAALLDSNVAKECARMILPMGSTTEIHITGNLRNLLSFLNVRCDTHAQKEIQDIAIMMGEAMEKELPEIMGKINWRDGMFL